MWFIYRESSFVKVDLSVHVYMYLLFKSDYVRQMIYMSINFEIFFFFVFIAHTHSLPSFGNAVVESNICSSEDN